MTQTTHEERDTRRDFKQILKQIVHGVYYASHFVSRSTASVFRSNKSTHPAPGWQPGSEPPVYDPNIPSILRTGSAPIPHQHLSAAQQLARERDVAREFETRLQQQAGNILTRQYALSRVHRKASDQRLTSMTIRERVDSSLGFLDQELNAIVGALEQAAARQPLDVGRLSSDIQNALRAHVQLKLDLQQLRDSDITLFERDNALAEGNRRFASDVGNLMGSLGFTGVDERTGSILSEDRETRRSRSRSRTPSILTQYLSKRGDYQVLRDRVLELDEAHFDLLEERAIRRSREEELSTTDEEVQDNYQSSRRERMGQLGHAEKELFRLEDLCKARGLDTSFDVRSSTDSGDEERPALVGGPYVVVPQWMEQIPSPCVDNIQDGDVSYLPDIDLQAKMMRGSFGSDDSQR